MAASYFFYDLETSGINPREARVMQFAGQRTDMDLNPIGEPCNLMIKLTPDIVPDPDAIMITGITPQQTIMDGVTEAEFLRIFYDEVVIGSTIFLGFNTVRFDDEFMRYLHYRNFYDAYEWQWCDDCSRWDILDVVRMTRALRPEGINWPSLTVDGRLNSDGVGKPTNRLEYLTKLNGLDHEHAHDALSDVMATIAVTKLLRDRQPRLFEYLMNCRSKKQCRQHIDEFVQTKQPFLYCSGRYPSEFLHTTAVKLLAHHETQPYGYVYDLRIDPTPFMSLSDSELVQAALYQTDHTKPKLPLKFIKYNRCPAIAPIGAIKDPELQKRLQLDLVSIQANLSKLKSQTDFIDRLITAIETAEASQPYHQDVRPMGDAQSVDSQLYAGDFFPQADKAAMRTLREASVSAADFAAITVGFKDARLQALLPLYKARNFPQQLSSDERAVWDDFCRQRVIGGGKASRLATYFRRIDELAGKDDLTSDQTYALEELHLYGESIVPEPLDSSEDDELFE